MANTTVSATPGWPGKLASPAPRRPPVAKRRRAFLAVAVLLVLGIAALANYGPLHTYYDARARLDQAATAVETLQAEKAALQSELAKLTQAGYLESLAREELTYSRPGEDVYIITGAGNEAEQRGEGASSEPLDERGPLEKLLSTLGDLF